MEIAFFAISLIISQYSGSLDISNHMVEYMAYLWCQLWTDFLEHNEQITNDLIHSLEKKS